MDGRKRVEIENVTPQIDCGRYPVKRTVGDEVVVGADIICDGHDELAAVLLHRKEGETEWREAPMNPVVNDRWEGVFLVDKPGRHHYKVSGWVDHFRTWQKELRKKYEAGQDVEVQLQIGIGFLERAAKASSAGGAGRIGPALAMLAGGGQIDEKVALCLSTEITGLVSDSADRILAVTSQELSVAVGRGKAQFSTWYELFPRSWSREPGRHGTFRDCEELLPQLAGMGFDVLYLPPVHPIGTTSRKGKNNSPTAEPGDPGSPWAIGAAEGGHKAVHPELGTIDDFVRFVRKAEEHGIEIAMDIAFQCSPDHPYVREHPEWFLWRPDGTVQFAENPPKRYEDIVPFHFENQHWGELWEELKSVVLFWREKGVKIFRVDNPHTKPFRFWEWLIRQVESDYPEVIFLAEAFTRPKVMYRLAKLGFSQSYTYFTWRTSKRELTSYLNELTRTDLREYFRPNFWPNTPDILPEFLQYGGKPAFKIRLVLAATLSSNYGIYGPAFELCLDRTIPGKEEYLDGEKYQLRDWDWDAAGNMKSFIAAVNRIRRENRALQRTDNVAFYETDNENIICYAKTSRENILLIVVNLDPATTQTGSIRIPLDKFGISPGRPYLVHDLLTDGKFIWQGERNSIELDPRVSPARIFRIISRLRKEADFDYFM